MKKLNILVIQNLFLEIERVLKNAALSNTKGFEEKLGLGLPENVQHSRWEENKTVQTLLSEAWQTAMTQQYKTEEDTEGRLSFIHKTESYTLVLKLGDETEVKQKDGALHITLDQKKLSETIYKNTPDKLNFDRVVCETIYHVINTLDPSEGCEETEDLNAGIMTGVYAYNRPNGDWANQLNPNNPWNVYTHLLQNPVYLEWYPEQKIRVSRFHNSHNQTLEKLKTECV